MRTGGGQHVGDVVGRGHESIRRELVSVRHGHRAGGREGFRVRSVDGLGGEYVEVPAATPFQL